MGSNADEGGEKHRGIKRRKDGDKEPQEGGRVTETQRGSRPRKKKHPYSEVCVCVGGGGSSLLTFVNLSDGYKKVGYSLRSSCFVFLQVTLFKNKGTEANVTNKNIFSSKM